jgi:superfamily II DNA or RNA helicase
MKSNNEDSLYPSIENHTISEELAEHPDFQETKFTKKLFFKKKSKKHSLAPHQKFVKLFLDFETDYESLLLYHGLGTGKTCSSISCSESFLAKKCNTFIVCPEVLKSQYKSQLFKEISKDNTLLANCPLKYFENLLKNNQSKEEFTRLIQSEIERYFFFFDYDEMADFVTSNLVDNDEIETQRNLNFFFDYSLIIIDECHKICQNQKLKKALENTCFRKSSYKLLLMSATPIYQNIKEIDWLLDFLKPNSELKTLAEKINGVVSYVKGDNPITFPKKIIVRNNYSNSSFQSCLFLSDNNEDKIDKVIKIVNESDGIILVYSKIREHLRKLSTLLNVPIFCEELLFMVSSDENKNGEQLKVVLMDDSFAEGADFKSIRQLHVLEPCETFTKLQQIIGRACRSYSHKALKEEEQNVQIFLHSCPSEVKIYETLYKDYKPIHDLLEIMKRKSVDFELNSEQETDFQLKDEEIQLSWKRETMIYNYVSQSKYLNSLHL